MSITWPDAASFSNPHQITNDQLKQYLKNNNYSFQLFDGSLLQLYYQCSKSGDELEKAALSYYQYTNDEDGFEYIEDDLEGEEFFAENILTSDIISYNAWLRIDYSPQTTRGVIHSAAHLHTNMSTELRIPLKGFPTPKQFIEAVVAWFYPSEYSRQRLTKEGNYTNPEKINSINDLNICTGHEDGDKILHLSMPG